MWQKQCKGYGKKVMVWTDISNNYPDIISQFPKDLIPVLWEYSDNPSSMTKWLTPGKKGESSILCTVGS